MFDHCVQSNYSLYFSLVNFLEISSISSKLFQKQSTYPMTTQKLTQSMDLTSILDFIIGFYLFNDLLNGDQRKCLNYHYFNFLNFNEFYNCCCSIHFELLPFVKLLKIIFHSTCLIKYWKNHLFTRDFSQCYVFLLIKLKV